MIKTSAASIQEERYPVWTGKREDLPEVLRVEHVAQILGVSKSAAYTYTHTPGFPVVRFSGKCLRIPRDRFFEWLNGL